MKINDDRTDGIGGGDNKSVIISRLLGGGLHETTEEKIRAWLADEEDAEGKYRALEQLFAREYKDPIRTDIHTLRTLNELRFKIGLPEVGYRIVNGEVVIPAFGKHTARRTPMRRSVWLRVAAVVVPVMIAAGIGLLLTDTELLHTDTEQAAYTTVTVPAGETRTITLPDGSEARIAPESELTYADDFTGNRSVKLSGEAFFVVQRAGGSPFTVEAGSLTAIVLGTEFDVQARAGLPTTEVLLATGSVEVRTEKHTVVLKPSERFVLDNASGLSTISQADRVEIGTRKGTMLTLDNLPVEEALGKMAEFYGANISIRDGFHSDNHVRTVLHREDSLDEVMRMIQTIDPDLVYSIKGDTVTVANR